ncbi:hypothetical protein SASPL_129254 [Salvia splendens]|uniref:PGG domain-containing protein n=1 Tax=Salvia splendens TaxID=180675 RepID=A0A8X8ZNK5_SALSN|nr:hypothetical protein SASPL_129254 [Salvia splendens]
MFELMAFSEVKYEWQCSVNVANFVTVRPSSEGDDKTNEFKVWKKQMIFLLESQGVMGFVNGEIVAPTGFASFEQYSLWSRTDRLVKGWILGSIGTDVLHQLQGCETARDAIMRDNWQSTKHNFPDINDLCTTFISSRLDTILHIAVLTGNANDLVIKMVEIIPPEALALMDSKGETALHKAAKVGNTAAATALVDRNPNLLHVMNNYNELPVVIAAGNYQKKTLEYWILQHETNSSNHPSIFLGQIGIRVLNAIISSEYFDIALDLTLKYPNVAQMVDYETVWKKLEDMIWYVTENLVPKVKELKEKKSARAQALQLAKHLCDQIRILPGNKANPIFAKSLQKAAFYGISELVEMIMDICPWAILYRDTEGRDMFMLAATYRFENVINLLYNMNDSKYLFWGISDNQKNNLMHICGKLSPSDRLNLVAGPALQMQRELQWFKEMENIVPAPRRTCRNDEDQTPQMIFTKEHEKLKEAGEKWMKDTANACTIVAALIATVMFAAAFTVPEDFLYVLPKRLSIGLVTIFVSIIFMLAAFSATLYLVLQRDVAWFVVLLMAFACLPIASFVLLQFPLLVDVIYSTYGPDLRKQEFITGENFNLLAAIADLVVSVSNSSCLCSNIIINYSVPNVTELREKKSMRAQTLQLAKHLCNQIATLHGNEALKIFEKSIHLAEIYGISELVEMIIDEYHEEIYYRDSDTDKDVFSVAMANRFENVINVVYNMNDHIYMFCSSTCHHDNNLLHICVKLAPYRLHLVAGLALQMQCESQWLKEREYFVLASRRTWPNHEKQTPQILFTKEHEKLKEAGEKWMKDTANACNHLLRSIWCFRDNEMCMIYGASHGLRLPAHCIIRLATILTPYTCHLFQLMTSIFNKKTNCIL